MWPVDCTSVDYLFVSIVFFFFCIDKKHCSASNNNNNHNFACTSNAFHWSWWLYFCFIWIARWSKWYLDFIRCISWLFGVWAWIIQAAASNQVDEWMSETNYHLNSMKEFSVEVSNFLHSREQIGVLT